jgi:two-component system, NtrC family, sensor kinase
MSGGPSSTEPEGRAARPRLRRPRGVSWPHRLSTRLQGVVALLALGALAALWSVDHRLTRELRLQQDRSSGLLAEVVQRGMAEAMLDARPDHRYTPLARVTSLDGIESVRVIDKTGRVAFSTEAAERGAAVPKDAASCAPCHAVAPPLSQVPPESRARVEEGPRGHRHVLSTPIYNDRACATAACHVHPPGRQVLGILEIGTSMDRLEASVLAFRTRSVPLVVLAVLGVAVALYLLGRAEVLDPVEALLEGTRRVARDELDVEIRVRSRGEMGQLGRSFNDMTRSLRALEDALNALLSRTEDEVAARTEELRAAHAQLVRTEKLSALGKLSASVAHEINNPLAGILTFAKLVSRTLGEGPPDDTRRAAMRRNLGLVEREAQRCSAIVKNLLDFARERPMAVKEVDANAVVEEALSLVADHAAVQQITLVHDLVPLPPVQADFGQLRQAVVNVVMNACEAMGKGGRLTVASRLDDGAIELSFADTGPGIPPERLAHIFDPFFTTKEKGTGLGLSVVYGIVERHGGTVKVDSKVGQGTTFTFRLPLPERGAGAAARPETAA